MWQSFRYLPLTPSISHRNCAVNCGLGTLLTGLPKIPRERVKECTGQNRVTCYFGSDCPWVKCIHGHVGAFQAFAQLSSKEHICKLAVKIGPPAAVIPLMVNIIKLHSCQSGDRHQPLMMRLGCERFRWSRSNIVKRKWPR